MHQRGALNTYLCLTRWDHSLTSSSVYLYAYLYLVDAHGYRVVQS